MVQRGATPSDPLAPFDLSPLCDGRRTDFPLGMLVETAKVMLNGVYLQEDLDFLVRHKDGQSKIELRRPPAPGDRLIVLRVPAHTAVGHQKRASRSDDVPPYEQLPKRVKDNIAPRQWPQAQREVVHTGVTVPESGQYINLKNGLVGQYVVGETANGPLFPVHALAGARGKEDRPFQHAHDVHHVPPGARPT
jgi:hypothetical protein